MNRSSTKSAQRAVAAALCLGAVLIAGCSRAQAPAPCAPAPLRPTAGPEAMDALMDSYMRDGLAGRPVPDEAQRQAARRALVLDCINARADSAPADTALDAATAVVTQACSALIGRYIQSDAADAALRGDPPASPTEMAAMREEFTTAAAARLKARRNGKCQG